jgi:hypothetical protein
MFAHLPVVRMQLDLKSCGVRSFRDADAAVLARHANNRKVWQQLRDRFPHPYTTDDACGFITFARGADPETAFAVTSTTSRSAPSGRCSAKTWSAVRRR